MFIAHLPAGYILTKTLQSKLRTQRFLTVGLIASLLPDLDMLYFYLLDNRAHLHHSYWTHIPFFWLIIAFTAFICISFLKKKEYFIYAIIVFSNIFLHLFLDTVVGRIEWLQPFSSTSLYLFTVPNAYGFWIYNFLLHWTALFEVGIIIWALVLFIINRKKKDSSFSHNSENETLQTYTKDGKPSEPLPRSLIYAEPRKYFHGVANIWIINSKGELLCSKRSDNVKGNLGKWQTFFGGHVQAGETFLQGAQRELAEETGINGDENNFHLIEKGKNEAHRHFFEGYLYIYKDELLDFIDKEIAEMRWLSFEDYNKEKTDMPDIWCNSCNIEKQKIITELLTRFL